MLRVLIGNARGGVAREVEGPKSAAHKRPTSNDGLYGGQKLASRIGLENIPACSYGKRSLHHIDGSFLTHQEYFRFWGQFPNRPRSLDSIQLRKTEVKQN